ncbi:MAG: transcription elongation factor GreB [Flammeovirgaceae bacterium]|nr:transcription elongation factor GreB [Flammeovirgaceae bacterium]
MKNYITPEGFKALQTELNSLIKSERPEIVKVISWAAGNGDRSENGDYIYGKKKLRQIDSRIKFLLMAIEDADIIHPSSALDKKRVYFGAMVKLLDDQTKSSLDIRIVGAHEINHKDGNISWLSPLAKSLIGRSSKDIIEVQAPDSIKVYIILEVNY